MDIPADSSHPSLASLIPEIDRLAAEALAVWKVPGAALAIVQGGEIALARAYGQRDVEADLPVTPRTQFVICSITNLHGNRDRTAA